MHKVKYNRHEYRNEYLRSEEWKTLHETVLRADCDCQVCNKNKATDVHHLVYRNLIDVTVNDLLPVCRDCHNLIHRAIDDLWISHHIANFNEIKQKTLNIKKNDEYEKYVVFLKSKHLLPAEDIEFIKKAPSYALRKICAVLKKNIWYGDLHERKFTGRQLIKIKKIIQLVKFRKKENRA